MKTLVLKVVSQNRAIKGGLIRLTENVSGKFHLEGEGLHGMTAHLNAVLMAAIDACVCGYEDPMMLQQDFYVVAV